MPRQVCSFFTMSFTGHPQKKTGKRHGRCGAEASVFIFHHVFYRSFLHSTQKKRGIFLGLLRSHLTSSLGWMIQTQTVFIIGTDTRRVESVCDRIFLFACSDLLFTNRGGTNLITGHVNRSFGVEELRERVTASQNSFHYIEGVTLPSTHRLVTLSWTR